MGRPLATWSGYVDLNTVTPRKGYVEFKVTLDYQPDRDVWIAVRNSKVKDLAEELLKVELQELKTGD